MRVAICFSGGMKNFPSCYPSIYKYLIKPTNADVFCYLYSYGSKDDIKKLREECPHNSNIQEDNCDAQFLISKLKPKSKVIEKYGNGIYDALIEENSKVLDDENYSDDFFREKAITAMDTFHAIKKCNDLKKEYEVKNRFKYDIVIRARLDHIWCDYVNLTDIKRNNTILFMKDKFTEKMHWNMNDKFFASNSKMMDKFVEIYTNIYRTYLEYKVINGEFDKNKLYAEFDKGCIIETQQLCSYTVRKNDINTIGIGHANTMIRCTDKNKITNRNRTILVTGCCGFIGSAVSERLLQNGYKVIGIDRECERLDTLEVFDNFEFRKMDIDTTFNMPKVDAVCHLATMTGERNSNQYSERYYRDVAIFRRILDEAVKNNIKSVVYASSCSVYGYKKAPLVETDVVNQHTTLGYCKYAMEKMAELYNNKYDLSTFGLRLFTVYGPNGRRDSLIFKLMQSVRRNVPFVCEDNGQISKDFIYIDDVANIFMKVLQIKLKKENKKRSMCEVYNVGSGKSYCLKDLIKLFNTLFDIQIELETGTERTQKEIANTQKMNTIHEKCSTSFNVGIKKVFNSMFV